MHRKLVQGEMLQCKHVLDEFEKKRDSDEKWARKGRGGKVEAHTLYCNTCVALLEI